jgi:hypothetical protein
VTVQDYLDEMKSSSSNAIFLLMWPIFNVLLVRYGRCCVRIWLSTTAALQTA